jgi:hypothetical protein
VSLACSENADLCGAKVLVMTDPNNYEVDMVTSNAFKYDALTNTVSNNTKKY